MNYDILRSEVLGAAQAMLKAGLTVGDSGNVSGRGGELDGKVILAITPHGRYYDELAPHDIVIVDEEGEPIEGKGIPSAELLLHAAVYRARPDVNAVIHCHPPLGSAVAVMGVPIPPILEDQMIFLGGQIETAPHAITGSEELVGYAVEALGDRNACLLSNHGAIAVGHDLKSALTAAQYLEKLAMAFLYATWSGRLIVLPPAVVEAEKAFFKMNK